MSVGVGLAVGVAVGFGVGFAVGLGVDMTVWVVGAVGIGVGEDDLIVNKSISLIGENSQSTILQEKNYFNGQVFGAHALIYIQANDVTIQGFTLDGNKARSYGILSEYSHTRIVGNNILNNTSDGIYCEKPGIEIFSNYIFGNNITNNGSAGIGGSG